MDSSSTLIQRELIAILNEVSKDILVENEDASKNTGPLVAQDIPSYRGHGRSGHSFSQGQWSLSIFLLTGMMLAEHIPSQRDDGC